MFVDVIEVFFMTVIEVWIDPKVKPIRANIEVWIDQEWTRPVKPNTTNMGLICWTTFDR